MKKTKVLALLSVLMIAAMLLVSCGGTPKASPVSSFAKVLNADYDYAADLVASATALTELNDYAVVEQSDEFVVFAGATDEGAPVQKVFSLRAASVVLTLTATESTAYEVELVDDLPVFAVAKAVEDETTYTVYDATGAGVASTTYDLDAPSEFADLIVFAGVAYEVDDDGKLTKFADLPENLVMDADVEWSENYFYVFNETRTAVQIFDRSFKFVANWYAPSAALNCKAFVLNGGDLLVQYNLVLDDKTDEYDRYEKNGDAIVKYDVVTKLVSAKNGKTKDIDCNYVIYSVVSAYSVKESTYVDADIIADSLKNLAVVAPIVDKQIDDSEAARDFVTMNDKGKIQKSVKLVDGQVANLPELVGEDLYLVRTLYGQVLTNAKGKIVQIINNDSMKLVGGYLVGEMGVYDLEMNKVYDLLENKAKVLETIGDTLFIIKGEDEEVAYDVIALRNGEEKTVASFDVEKENNKIFTPLEGVDAYAILDVASGEYTYYNAAGEELIKTKALLVAIASNNDTVLMSGIDGESAVYYVFAE